MKNRPNRRTIGAVFAWLRENPGKHRRTEVAQATGHPRKTVGKALFRLWRRGHVTRDDERFYSVGDRAQTPDQMDAPVRVVTLGLPQDLGVGALAFPEFSPIPRDVLLNLNGTVRLSSVGTLLAQSTFDLMPSASKKQGLLRSYFHTPHRLTKLGTAYEQFNEVYAGWHNGHIRNSRATWLLPEGVFETFWMDGSVFSNSVSRIGPTTSRKLLGLPPSASRWMPLLSLELIGLILSIRVSELGDLKTAIARGSDSLVPGAPLFPWEADYPDRLRPLPISWSYQFLATDPYGSFIRRLTRAYCSNVGHLVVFAPEAITAIKQRPYRWWATVAAELRNSNL